MESSTDSYLPWARLQRLLPKLGPGEWTSCCVLGVQERTLSATSLYGERITNIRALRLDEPDGSPWDLERRVATEKNGAHLDELQNRFGASLAITDYSLIGRDEDQIRAVKNWIHDVENVSLDISGLPERAIFWAIKFLLSSTAKSIVVTYCQASGYTEHTMFDVAEPRYVAMFHGGDGLGLQTNLISVGFDNPGLAAAIERVSEIAGQTGASSCRSHLGLSSLGGTGAQLRLQSFQKYPVTTLSM